MGIFRIIVLTPAGEPQPSMAIAASRAGELGVLNCEQSRDKKVVFEGIERLDKYAKNDFGIKLDGQANDFIMEISSYLTESMPDRLRYIILTPGSIQNLRKYIHTFHDFGLMVFLESICLRQAQIGKEIGADGIVAKGHEAGGKIGEETSFILLQKILSHMTLPVWAYGGIGLHTAAVCYAAKAEGIVLDSQLLLTKESPISKEMKIRLGALDGSETTCLGESLNSPYRVYGKQNHPLIKEFLDREDQLAQENSIEKLKVWRELIRKRVGWDSLNKNLFLLGQDITFASSLAQKFGTVGGVLQGFRRSIQSHIQSAMKTSPLEEGSSLARSHGTRYPIVQGPMARISDVPQFARQVADEGALPFIELAMMREKEVKDLLGRCESELAGRPWGVGILGFVSEDLFKEQTQIILAHKPAFALIAGGRPEQVKFMEKQGILTYIHCPSPELLKIFLKMGLRRFIFEGMESGGHLGPRTSFTLWDKSLEVLLDFLSSRQDASSYQVLFAGGIHDALSASMVSMLAAPLSSLGVQVGVQIGSAYLFTEQVVDSKAIVKEFQVQALSGKGTVRLQTSPGYVTRCLPTPYTQLFAQEKRKMLSGGRSINEVRDALESMTLGRLRISAKGIDRDPSSKTADPHYIPLNEEDQLKRGIYMIGQIVAMRDRICTIEELHADISQRGTEEFKKFIEAEKEVSSKNQVSGFKAPEIAIVGMACILPKASGLHSYWENILNKVNAIQEIPPDRWDHQLYYNKDRKAKDKIYSKWGGFIDEVPFDPMDYGMPPNTLYSIEPLHLITLQVVREALRNAGYLDRFFRRDRASVIIGAGGGVADLGIKYSIRSFLPLLEHISEGKIQSDLFISELKGFLPEWTEDSFAGILMNVAAGRVANRFDMGGSNFTVDAACASSMAAVYLGVKELQTYSSDMVVVGGSDTMQNPFTFLCFSKTQALSPTGRSSPLDESADGIVLGEGVAVAILKRLADAERDGDRIYAVIKSVGSSSDGRDKCLTAPRPEGQISALERAYDQAGICPSTVGLIEAHGTGTEVGDRTEVQALSHVFKSAQAKNQSCAVGAVKSMIGHTKCTSGVAGLIKTAMALYSKTLPPTMNVTDPNRKANFAQTPFYVNTDTRPWLNSMKEHPRRAGVSAFGFGGTNFHTVLEEYTQDFSDGISESFYRQWPGELCVWAANSREELQKKVNKVSKDLQDWKRGIHPPLSEIAYSQWKEMQSIDKSALADVRLAVVTSSHDDLYQKLDRVKEMLSSPGLLHIQDPQGIYLIERAARVKGKVAFLFPGQGAQYLNMVKELAIHFPEVLSCFERLDRILQPKLGRALSDYIFPRPVFTDEEKADQQKALTRTSIAQPAIGAVSVALGQLLSELEIYPDMVAGHSYGEYVALWAGGSLTEESLMLLSEARGRIVEDAVSSCPGTMAAMNASKEELSEIVSGKEGVWMANYNSPQQTVISGIPESVQAVVNQCKSKGIKARMLPVSCAFHSPLVRPAQEKIAEFLNALTIHDAKLPVYSNTTANPHSYEAKKITQYMIDHLTHPVKFMQEIEAMYEADARIFIEVGPRSILTNLVNQILDGRPHTTVALDQVGRSGLLQLQYCLGQLIVQGIPINLDRLYVSRIDQKENWLQKKDDSVSLSKPSNTWMIRGDRIRPLQGESIQTRSNEQNHFSKKVNKSELQKHVEQKEVREKNIANSAQKEDKIMGEDLSTPKTGDLIMHQFQQMMNKFLDTQKTVMAGYLRTGFSGEASEAKKYHVTAQNLEESVERKTAQEEYKNEVSKKEAFQEKKEIEDVPTLPDRPDKQKVQELLLRIVSERTGYPSEMLGLDLDMEADLGIDSIKRVEILGSLQEEIGGSCQGEGEEAEKEMGEFGGIKTLQGIIDWITQSGETKKELADNVKKSDAQEANVEERREGDISKGGDIQRFLVNRVKTPCLGDQIAFDKNRIVVITEDQRGLAGFLDCKLQEQGYKVARIRIGDNVEEIEPGYYTANLGLYEDVNSLLALIHQRQGPIGALIHLYPFRSDQGIFEMDLIQWKRLLNLEVKSLFYLAKSLETELREAASSGASCLMAVTSMGGSFGSGCMQSIEESLKPSTLGMQSFSPVQGGCAGLIKSLKYEWPEVNLKVVDLNPQDKKENLAHYLLDEMRFGQNEVEVGYQQGNRYTLQPLLSELSLESESQFRIDSSWTLLLTGGARGITSDVAKELARQYQPTLLLVGSSPFPEEEIPFEITGSLQEIKARLIEHMKLQGEVITPARVESKYQQLMKAREIRTNVKAMQDLGSRVQYFQADVRDERSLAGLIDNIYQSYGKIDGVIHGAGIIEDKFIKDKAPESFDRVFDTKVDSAFILSQKLHLDSLKFLVFFSSVAGRFGNRGQGDYAAANEVLNKLAIYLNARWPARVVSINWGPWENSNMVSPLLDKEFKKHGIQLIPRDVGPQRLDQEICYGVKGDAEIILGGGWKSPINKRKHVNQLASHLVEGENNSPLGQRRVKEDFQMSKAFPLLESGIVFSPNGKGIVKIVRELNAANDLYLQDHKLNGNPVLPMAMALELMVETVSLGWPEWRIERVCDLRVLKGVVVSRPTKVHIKAIPSQPNSSENLSVKVEMKDAQTPSICCYSTIVELRKKGNGSFRWQPLALSEAKPFPMSTREAYQQWLFHGPLFHGISEIHQIGANGINGILIPSSPKKLLAGDPQGTWLIDPVIVDSGLQMIILWSRTYWDMMPLPSRFQQFRSFGPLSGSKIRFETRILPNSTPGMLHADLAFFNEEGKLIALLEDMEAACSKSLNRLTANKNEQGV